MTNESSLIHFATTLSFYELAFGLISLIYLLFNLLINKRSAPDCKPLIIIMFIGISSGVFYTVLEMMRITPEVIYYKAFIFGASISYFISKYMSVEDQISDKIAGKYINDLLNQEFKKEDKD